MTLEIDGGRFYRIGEALEEANLSRSTYFRWVKKGRINDARFRDRNGRRILTPEEVRSLVQEANRLLEIPASDQIGMELHPREE